MHSSNPQSGGSAPSGDSHIAAGSTSAPRWSWPLAAVARHSKRPKHARVNTSHRLRDGAALALTGVLTFTGVSAGAAANQITGNITSVNVAAAFEHSDVTHERPVAPAVPDVDPFANQPLNILVLGIDARFNDDDEIVNGEIQGARADTTLIMHISANREHAAVISIPRDSIVDIPSCPTTTRGLSTRPMTGQRFNAAFARGYDTGGDVASGALCALTTVESLTQVHLDGFVVMDFKGFQNMVDALDGVEMCIDQDIWAPKADGLALSAGCHVLSGWQALQLARARTGQGLGDGSDLQRISRQQDLFLAIANQALRVNLLTDATRMARFLNATTQSMTASSNFASITGLASLARSFTGINTEQLDFIMVPVADNPEDRNTVVWTRAADELWKDVRYHTLFQDDVVADSDTSLAESQTLAADNE